MNVTMTVTKNEFGQMNMFAKEPSMYMTKEDLERYGIEPYAVKAEKMNGRWAMMGFAAAVISYAKPYKLTKMLIADIFIVLCVSAIIIKASMYSS
jgi:hypothetical protein